MHFDPTLVENSFETVDWKVAEAEFFLQQMASVGFDPKVFGYHFSAYLSASRTTTLALQRFDHLPGFGGWYEGHRIALRNNSLAKYFLDARNDHVHGGPYPVSGAVSKGEKCEYLFPGYGRLSAKPPDIVSAARDHLTLLLEMILNCYERFGKYIDPQQYFTKEHYPGGIDVAECEVWGWERVSLIEEGYDEDDRWSELRTRVGCCSINNLFYSYLGKVTPQPLEPDHFADFAYTPEEKGWICAPAGFKSAEEYWLVYPERKPIDTD